MPGNDWRRESEGSRIGRGRSRLRKLGGGRAGCSTGQAAAVTAIPGIVFSASLDGHLRGYEAETGQVVLDVNTAREFDTVNGVAARGGSMNGPGATVTGGMLFVSSGYG